MKNSRTIATYAIILALTMLAGLVPFIFLIPLLFTAVSYNFKTAMFAATAFGLVSYFYSFFGGGFVPIAFIKAPLIPILPRLLVGVVAYFSYLGMTKLIKKNAKLKLYLPKLTAAILGSLANTVLVIAFMYLLIPGLEVEGVTLNAYTPIMMTFGAIEVAVNAIIVPPLAIAVTRALKFRQGNTRKGNLM